MNTLGWQISTLPNGASFPLLPVAIGVLPMKNSDQSYRRFRAQVIRADALGWS